jgi:hypothetical protein
MSSRKFNRGRVAKSIAWLENTQRKPLIVQQLLTITAGLARLLPWWRNPLFHFGQSMPITSVLACQLWR